MKVHYNITLPFLQVFYCYTYGLAIIIFVYLDVFLYKNKHHYSKPTLKPKTKHSSTEKLSLLKARWRNYRREKETVSLDQKPQMQRDIDKNSTLNQRLVGKTEKEENVELEMSEIKDDSHERPPLFTHNAEGVNFFLLLGLLGRFLF